MHCQCSTLLSWIQADILFYKINIKGSSLLSCRVFLHKLNSSPYINLLQGLLERGLLLPSDPAVWVVQPVWHSGQTTVCRNIAKGWTVQLWPLQEVIIFIIRWTIMIIIMLVLIVIMMMMMMIGGQQHYYDYDYDSIIQCLIIIRGHQHDYGGGGSGGAGVEDKWRHTYPYVPTRFSSYINI